MSGKAHLAVLLVTLLSVGFILQLVRRRRLRAKYSILWLSIGVVLVGLAAWPRLLDRVSIWLGVSYGPATFLLGAVTLLFLIVIHFSWELSRLEERTRSLAEELAIRSIEAPSAAAHPGEHGGVGDAAAPAQPAAVGQGAGQQPHEAGERPAPAADDRRGGPPTS
jgi:hypothetical protein